MELCGYSSSVTALVKLNAVPYLQFYNCPKVFSNELIPFPSGGEANEPLIQQMWAVKGDVTATVEVMMKYHMELLNRRQKQIKYLEQTVTKLKNAESTKRAQAMDGAVDDDRERHSLALKKEIQQSRIF